MDQEYFESTEEEAHFYSVLSEFNNLLEDYSPQFVMLKLLEMQQDDVTLVSIN